MRLARRDDVFDGAALRSSRTPMHDDCGARRRRRKPEFGLPGTCGRSDQNWADSAAMHSRATSRSGSLEPGIVAQPVFMSRSLR